MNLEQLDLPIELSPEKTENSTHSILKLRYESTLTNAPNLTDLTSAFGQPVYLYQSHVDSIQGHLIGSFIVGVENTQLDLVALSNQLQQHIVNIEVLGYAKSTY